MEKLLGFVFVAIVILLVTLAFVPYKECFNTTSRDDFPEMLESCLENIQDHDKYAQIVGNEKHLKVAAALDKALTRDTSNSIVDYRESGRAMCVINPRKFQLPKNNNCKIRGRNREHSLQPTRNSVDPRGCLVNPNDPNFIEFLDDIDHIINKQEYDYIARLKANADRARENTKAREAQAAADRVKTQEAQQQNILIENENRSTRARVDAANQQAREIARIKDGSISEKAMKNARELINVTTNGVRWVMCDGRPRETWCLMDPNYDGGGWMLLAKMDEGTTFHFDSVHWEQSTELNPTDLTIEERKNRTIGDAKYPAFNSVPVKDIMVIFLIDIIGGHVTNQTTPGAQGWAWIIKDWWPHDKKNGTTALIGFSKSHARDAPESNPLKFDQAGLARNIWSHQYNEMKVVIGGHKHLQSSFTYGVNTWGSVRLGIACNENGPGDYLSNDTWCGIGGGNGSGGCIGNESMPSCFSAGDYYGCCGIPGQRRRFKALLFGR
jgi:hypothetical protein